MPRIGRLAVILVALASLLAGVPAIALAANPDNPTTFTEKELGVGPAPKSLAERTFHIEWKAGPGRPGMTRITGYVYDDGNQPAIDVELQATALDSAGNPSGAAIARVGGTVPARGRGYFDVQVPSGHAYEVRVVGFNLLDTSE